MTVRGLLAIRKGGILMKSFHQRPWVRRTNAIFTSGLLIAILSIGLAACGYGSASIASTLSQDAGQSQVQVQGQGNITKKCGTVQGFARLEVPVIDSVAAPVENCFVQAFRVCRPATLVYTLGSVDTVLMRTFTIHNNHGKCSITDAKQFRVVPRPLSPAQIFTCSGLTKLPNALRFNACGKDGNVVLPGV
jgi:hypothetical protein